MATAIFFDLGAVKDWPPLGFFEPHLLFSVPDLPPLLFSWLDPSSLALAACVCKRWRDVARMVRGEGKPFRLILLDLVPYTSLLVWATENLTEVPDPIRAKLCTFAASRGALATLQWAREKGMSWDESTCANAALGGYLVVLQWAHENGCPWDWGTCGAAALGGHLDTLQWAQKNGCPWTRAACLYGAFALKRKAVVAWIAAQPDE